MTEYKSMLCVGGPLAGQRRHVIHGAGFMVPVKSDAPSNDPLHPDWQPNKPPKVDFTRYRAELFRTEQGDVWFWVPEGQSLLESITMLLESYERSPA